MVHNFVYLVFVSALKKRDPQVAQEEQLMLYQLKSINVYDCVRMCMCINVCTFLSVFYLVSEIHSVIKNGMSLRFTGKGLICVNLH